MTRHQRAEACGRAVDRAIPPACIALLAALAAMLASDMLPAGAEADGTAAHPPFAAFSEGKAR